MARVARQPVRGRRQSLRIILDAIVAFTPQVTPQVEKLLLDMGGDMSREALQRLLR